MGQVFTFAPGGVTDYFTSQNATPEVAKYCYSNLHFIQRHFIQTFFEIPFVHYILIKPCTVSTQYTTESSIHLAEEWKNIWWIGVKRKCQLVWCMRNATELFIRPDWVDCQAASQCGGIVFYHKLSDGQHLRSLITFATSFTINIPSVFPPMLRDIKHSSFWQSNHKRAVIFAKDIEIMIDLWAIITYVDVLIFSWSSVLHFPLCCNSHAAKGKRKQLCLS